jgi:5'-3' exonuclease
MGIEKFYFAIRDKLNDNIIPLDDILTKATVLHIDFNSFIHKASEKVVSQLNNELLSRFYNASIKNFDLNYLPQVIEWRKSIDPIDSDINVKKRIISETIRSIDDRIRKADKAKVIYLALDGIPEMSKCIEQKNRRNIGFTISQIEENMEQHFSDTITHAFNQFNRIKFKFDRSEISAYTQFMADLVTELSSKYTSNDKIKISSVTEYGEGEKKIVYELLNLDKIDNSDVILIISPDADMILLAGIILCHIREKFKTNPNVYVHNKEIVNIKTLENYINDEIFYFNKKLKVVSEENVKKLTKDSAIFRDFIFLCTFFGNDFLPRILSFSEVYNNIDVLLIVYAVTLEGSNLGNLLNYNSNNYQINLKRLKAIIKSLVIPNNKFNNYRVYIDNKIENSIRHIDPSRMKETLDNLEKLGYEKTMYLEYINMKERETNKLFNVTDFDAARYICENSFHYFLFSKSSKTLVYNSPSELLEIIEENKRDIPRDIIKYIKGNFREFDYTIVAFRNKKSSWKLILDDYDYNTQINQPKEKIIRDYIDGLIWVTDWYFNRIMKKDHVSLWYYDHHTTPFLIHIYNFLETKELQSPANSLIDINEYFTKDEYREYIMLKESEKNKIKNYIDKISKVVYNSRVKYTSDNYNQVFKKLEDSGWNSKEVLISCKHARFLGKCVMDIRYMDFNTFIKQIREQKGGSIDYFKKFMKYMNKIRDTIKIE